MPGSESESEVLDFAALAHSIRPAALPVDAPGEATDKIAVEASSKADARTGVSWIWIAAGLGGILLGALGAIVIESQLQSETKTKATAVSEPGASPVASHAEPIEAVEPEKLAAPASAFVSVEKTPEESSAPALVQDEETTKPATVVSTESREPKAPSRKEPLSEEARESAKKKSVAQQPVVEAQEIEQPKVEEEKVEPAKPVLDLPAQPSREVVGRLLSGARPEMEACAAGRHGVATITIRVGSSGRVKSAIVDGAFQGSSEGSCMARVARKLRFPQFSEETFQVEYPYRL